MHSNEPYDPQQQLLNPEYLAFLRPGKAFCSEFFDCTIIPLGIASGEKSDICVVHWISIPVVIERVCAVRGIDSSEAKIQIGIDYRKSFLK